MHKYMSESARLSFTSVRKQKPLLYLYKNKWISSKSAYRDFHILTHSEKKQAEVT